MKKENNDGKKLKQFASAFKKHAIDNNPSKAILKAAQMPCLTHKVEQNGFDITKSEVIGWLVKQPEILEAMFLHYYQYTGAIVYDKDESKWKGRMYVG